jgi:tetrapyrrole methylase family protein/MazG family protein
MGSGRKKNRKKHFIASLLKIMAKLRSPSGCPWDREQTEQTLKEFLIEEAYETLEAIEAGTPEGLKEELGDLLLQIVFLSRIAEEKKEFDFSDVIHTLAEKLIRRHPHVFAMAGRNRKAVGVETASDVTHLWGRIKEQEGKYAGRNSILDDLPLALPALERARRMLERVSRAGLDRTESESVWQKIEEGLVSLKKRDGKRTKRAAQERFGDLLLALVNWACLRGLSAEDSLRTANRRFAKRFARLERKTRRNGNADIRPSPPGVRKNAKEPGRKK